MKFCENCGEKLEPNQKFCEKCGAKVNDAVVESSKAPSTHTSLKDSGSKGSASEQSVSQEKTQQVEKTLKPIPKGALIGIGAAAVLLIGGFFAYQKAEDYYSLNNQVDRYIESLQSRDYDEIASVLSTSVEDLEITSETIVPFVDTFLYDAEWNTVKAELLTNRSTDMLLLKKEGSNFLFFDNYELELLPAYVTLSTNIKDAKLFIGEEEMATSDQDEFIYEHGAVVPGEYAFKASVELDGNELMTEQTQTMWSGQDGNVIPLNIQGMHFEVSSNVEDAMVYVNDENIGQLEEMRGDFGPFGSLEGATLELRQEKSFGEIKTERIEMSDSDYEYYELLFPEVATEEDARGALQDMYNSLSNLTSDFQFNLESNVERFGEFFYEGTAYDELRPFYVDYAQRQRENEEVNYVDYEVRTSNFEQTAVDEYTVDMEVDYVSHYSGTEANDYTAPDDRTRTFTYTVTLVSETFEDDWGYTYTELFIKGFADEEMTFDSNEV